jgi:general stress protein 26
MQYNDTHLNFLREKIMETKVALFKSEINSELSLPTNVVQTISVDEEGNIYFFTSCNGNFAKNIDQPFYAYLDYHKKGYGERLCISGKAVIVKEDNEDIEPEKNIYGISEKSIVLVKMKIMQAEFFGQTMYQQLSFPQKIKNSINHIFFPSNEHHFKFG